MPTVEELQEQLLKEQEEKKSLAAKVEALTKEKTDKDAELTKVKEFNQKLYLRITSEDKKEEEKKEEPKASIEDMAKELFKL